MSTISIDYDGTYAVDPDFWDSFIKAATSRGHKVICVTNRAFTPEGRLPKIPMLLAGDEYKKDYAKSFGYNVDIWIDDMPGTITKSLLLP